MPLLELLRGTAAAVDVPLVATGGIADRDGVLAALAAGAAAAQIGTAFLLSPGGGHERAAPRALARGGDTAITRAFTGRRARGLVNASCARTRTRRPRIRRSTT